MKMNDPAANKCRSFSVGSKAATLQVDPDRVAQEQAGKDAQGAVKVALVDAEVSARPTR